MFTYRAILIAARVGRCFLSSSTQPACITCGSLLLIELNPTCICITHRYFPKTIAEGEADVLCAGEDMTTHYAFTLVGLHLVIVTCLRTVVVRVCARERRRQFSSHFNLIKSTETLFLSPV
jgi:hypothetical protein